MLIPLFLRLEWMKLARSSSFVKSLLQGIFLGLLGLILLSYLAALGVFLWELLDMVPGITDKIRFLNEMLIYYFVVELFIRYFMQKMPVFDLQKFMHLPISKRFIIHYLLVRSWITPLNLISILLFMPIAINQIAPLHGGTAAVSWMVGLVLVSSILHGLMLWFKQRFDDSWVGMLALVVVFMASIGAFYYGYFHIGAITEPFFTGLLHQLLWVFMLLALCVGAYLLAFRYYLRHASSELGESATDASWTDRSLGVFGRFGLAGELAEAEWKLIIRHKKSRTYLIITAIFLLYGIQFYSNNPLTEEGFNIVLLMPAIIITGMFMMNYGQFLISWNSSHFDFFLSRPHGIDALIRGKFLLFLLATLVILILSVPYVWFGWHILWIHIAVALFNVGISMHFMAIIALWSPKPMDINKGGVFNYEGVGCAQFVMIIPVVALPMVIYAFARWLTGPYMGLLILGLIGFTGLMLFPKMAGWSIQKCLRNKYDIAASFRNQQN